MKTLILTIALLNGCSYNGYNDPNIEFPALWQVDNHELKKMQREGMDYEPSENRYWCGVYG